jgi:hypothetical protein
MLSLLRVEPPSAKEFSQKAQKKALSPNPALTAKNINKFFPL